MQLAIGRAVDVLVLDANEDVEVACLRALPELGAHVLEHCVTLQSALELLASIRPHVIVVNPKPWGPRVIAQLQTAACVPVLVMSAHVDLEHVLACIEAGAAGYVTTPIDAPQLMRALHDVIEGRSPFSADVCTLLLPLLRDRRSDLAHAVDLTDRERNVLGLLVNGHAYAAIADALGIGLGTVQSHVKNLYRKLDVCTKAEAATIAFRHGLLSVRPERRRARALS